VLSLASGVDCEYEVKVLRKVSPESTSNSSPMACTTASALPTAALIVGLSSALPARQSTCERYGSFASGHSPRLLSEVTA